MTDFDFDCREKKRIAAGAWHKKGGSKSKGCRLPSDNLTPAQIKKLNGEVKTLELNKPRKYCEFKTMSREEKAMYLKYLSENYSASQRDIGQMMGVSNKTISLWMADLGIKAPSGKGQKTPDGVERWARFVDGEIKEPAVERPKEKVVGLPGKDLFRCESGNITVYANPNELAQMLSMLCGEGKRVYTVAFGDAE